MFIFLVNFYIDSQVLLIKKKKLVEKPLIEKLCKSSTNYTDLTNKFKSQIPFTNCKSIVNWPYSLGSGLGGPITLGKNISEMYFLSKFQTSALIGIMLGDGSTILQKSKRSVNAYFYYKQSFDHFYNLWNVFTLFSPFCKVAPEFKKYFDKRTNKYYTSISVRTRAFPIFTSFHNMFYISGKKFVRPPLPSRT